MKQALIKLHTAVFLWGFTGVLGRLISLNEGLLVWYRMLITIVTLYIIMRIQGRVQSVAPRQRNQLLGIGILIAMHWCFFYGSIKYSNVSIALTCLSSAGLFTAILEPLLTRKKIVLAEVLLGALSLCGIWLIFHFDPQYKTGIILGVTCTLMSCLFSIFNKTQVAYTAPQTVMLYELGGGLVFLTLIMPLYLHYLPTAHLLPQKLDIVWLLIMSWFCTVLSWRLSLDALKKVSAFTQGLTLNLEPVYGIILAFVVYHENKFLSKWFYFGFALILIAVMLQMIRVVRSRHKEM